MSSSSSLKNTITIINSFINGSNERALLHFKHVSKLLNDLSNLLTDSDFYDVEIKIGVGQNVKTFMAHANILKTRSTYFKAALTTNLFKRSENGTILFEQENVSPKTFEILLT